MKINTRILLIILIVVSVITFSSNIVYNSLANTFLKNQHSKTILNSTNAFIFSFQNIIEKSDEEIRVYDNIDFTKSISNKSNLDFIFILDELKNFKKYYFNEKIRTEFSAASETKFDDFISKYPNALINKKKKHLTTIYYGKLINENTLDEISKKISAEVALFVDDNLLSISNNNTNYDRIPSINKAFYELKYKNNFDLSGEEHLNEDFIASKYTPNEIVFPNKNITFIIFSTSKELLEFKSTMKFIVALIVIVSIALSIIIVLIFTAKMRKQITLVTEVLKKNTLGDLSQRVDIISKDEIGNLGISINNMLDEIDKKEKAEKEYTEFITLLNRNPSLKEVSEQAINKIIGSLGLTIGILYLIENEELRVISVGGINSEIENKAKDKNYYKNIIKKKEIIEFHYEKNNPIVKTGIAEIRIKYLVMAPIIYNQNVIAILELASDKMPKFNAKHYLENILDQLAVGLTNAKALEQLENFISELRKLNEEYFKQNEQVTIQNNELINLHNQLKDNANELELQRSKAVELTKVKSEFLASMSHELRTPLNSILGLSELVIKDETTTNRTKERLSVVLKNGNKLLNLISNILEFSKIESGKIETKLSNFTLIKLIEEIITFIEPLIIEKNLSFNIYFKDNKDYYLKSDKEKIEQILINLLGNAVKFTESGNINLSFFHQEDNLVFEVEDTGIGIDENNLTKIFNEFQQIDASTSRKYGGTGLGLAICKKYIESLNGIINVSSKLNIGTKFKVTIPNSIIDIIEKSEIGKIELNYSQVPKNLNEEIIIINSNKHVQKLISDYLKTNGKNYKNFSSGSDFINSFDDLSPSAFIVDINLSDINIWNFLFELNQKNRAKKPIIITSIDEKNKLGYGFAFEDIITSQCNDKCFTELATEFNTNRLLVISERNANEYIINDVNILEMDYDSFDINFFKKEKFGVIIIDLFSNVKNIKIYSKLKKNKPTRNFPIVFDISKYENKESENIKRIIYNLVEKENNHPMDVLKVIRDKLSISLEKEKLLALTKDDIQSSTNKILYFNETVTENKKSKILIVDDDNDTLFTIGELVGNFGYDTIFARNGIDCLMKLNNEIPDIILLDIMMPQMDGFETIKKIRENSRFKNLIVIALTAYAMLDNKEVIEKNGFNDLITKPVNSIELETALKNYLGKIGKNNE